MMILAFFTWILGVLLFWHFLHYIHGQLPIEFRKVKSYVFSIILLIIFLISLNQLILLINGTTK